MTQEILDAVQSAATDTGFGIWFLIGASLVFFMQAGFAMVETGFTRAKNAGNIIMKNLMDFCIGVPVFMLLGYSLLMGDDIGGFIGAPSFEIFTNYKNFDWAPFVFNMVFCATTATIVSGAMAERTKFLSYCVYSAVISMLVYPIEAHWIWGGGWLAQWGFHDFAGSTAIHMVGGIAALVGATILGPRIGKFDKNGKPKAIPGHSLTLGALGCFILWFGWYGFNGAAATSTDQLGSIFMVTTIAPAIATVVCMIFTWIKYGKPDVSMCLNASLAGLVAITAPCDVTDAGSAAIIGAVAGLLVCFGVWLLDYKLKVDDPVGAVAVHMMNGIWGTIAVGLFANPDVPGYSLADQNGNQLAGVFYGGGGALIGRQLVGLVAVAAWAAITMIIVFQVIKHTIGLRASEQEEIIGLDATEHGLVSSYADFAPAMAQAALSYTKDDAKSVTKVEKSEPVVPVEKAIQVESYTTETPNADGSPKMTKIVVICRQQKLNDLIQAFETIDVTGVTVTNVLGCGMQKGKTEYYRGAEVEASLLPKVKVEVVVCKVPTRAVIDTAKNVLYTGHIGDGKIFVYNIENVVKVRTGEEGYDALQDD
ncbi:MAG: ammonium transporter [Ruminococcus sp.]|nr:ammonium transporter [Ruminococcus sp.]